MISIVDVHRSARRALRRLVRSAGYRVDAIGAVARPGMTTLLASCACFTILLAMSLVAPVFGFRTLDLTPAPPDALSRVYFAGGATEIRPQDRKVLDAYVGWLRGEGARRLLIEGFTDEPGDSPFSRRIGEQRAKSAKAYLVARGVAADRITTVSRGGGRPACRERTPSCRALNRRATLSPALAAGPWTPRPDGTLPVALNPGVHATGR